MQEETTVLKTTTKIQETLIASEDEIVESESFSETTAKHNPVSLSPAVYQLIRNELHFKGSIITNILFIVTYYNQ